MARKKLGKYEIIDRIGRGGMAEVYRGYHASLDRYVAIKLLHPFLADDPEFKDRFENEARNVARLRHPNIVQVYDFDFDPEGESYYMVMELINGPTLKDRLFDLTATNDHISTAEAIRIARSAAEALAYAHQRNMIHRDVKPANLMIDEDGRVVLTDFGIAKIVTGAQFTASGGMVGTPAYMAPEQGLGEAGDERSDIYSLGVILYQLIAGRLPFDADTPLAIILKHVNEPLPEPSRYRPDIASDLERVICKVLEKEAKDRFQTAIQFAQELSLLDENGQRRVGGEIIPSPFDTRPDPPMPAQRATLAAAPPQSGQIDVTPVVTPALPGAPPRGPSAPLPRPGTPGRLNPGAIVGLSAAMLVVILVSLILYGGKGSPFALFAPDDATVTPLPSQTHVVVVPSRTTLPEPTDIPVREITPSRTPNRTPATATPRGAVGPVPSSTPTVQPTVTDQPSAAPTATPTVQPSATAQPSTTASAAPTQTSSVTATPTPSTTASRTPSMTRTPTPTATASPNRTGTALANFYETQAAASPTPNMTQTLAACEFSYIVLAPENYLAPPSFRDVADPRLIPAGTEFALDYVFENTGTCDWPDGVRLAFNAELTENPDESVNLDPLREACQDAPVEALNFARQEQPNFYLSGGEVGITEDSGPLTFIGTAPRTFGCYYSVWDLLYPNSSIPLGRPLLVNIRVWGGG